jgi:hypothetical protein
VTGPTLGPADPVGALTLYAVAKDAMEAQIEAYLDLASRTSGFSAVTVGHAQSAVHRQMILAGIGSPLRPGVTSAEDTVSEWQRMQSVPFSVENAVTPGVYDILRDRVAALLTQLQEATDNFRNFGAEFIHAHPYLLPVYQRLLNAPSKSKLKELVGSVNDNAISRPAAARIAAELARRDPGRTVTIRDLSLSIEPTLEGIVRDLVGRLLLEEVVANALDKAGVIYKRESEYAAINGVLYDFRADFVVPDESDPVAFIEVRKSSSRHASLYAKDKMFSAINWKGHNKKLMAILMTEGPWTEQTLQVMTRVFDYVIPVRRAPEMAEIVAAYAGGDSSKLRVQIDFTVRRA